MFAVREPSVIRGKGRSRESMSRQKLLFERSSQREPSGFERVEETFNIDSINIPEQAADIAVQQEHVEQMEQPIRRGRGRPPSRECERRGNNRGVDNRDARRDARSDARRNARSGARRDAAAGDASNVHMKDV